MPLGEEVFAIAGVSAIVRALHRRRCRDRGPVKSATRVSSLPVGPVSTLHGTRSKSPAALQAEPAPEAVGSLDAVQDVDLVALGA